MTGSETILISTYLEPEHVERIDSLWAGEVLYAPELMPRPRYVAEHGGVPPHLNETDQARWRSMLERAEICFDFDWWQPGSIVERCPALQWVQATSAGIGGFVQRYGLDRSEITFTTAAGTHAVPLAEFAVMGTLFHVKNAAGLLARQREHHWERYTAQSLAGRRVTVVGLGEIGRHTARTFQTLGAIVVGVGRPGGARPELPGVELTDTDSLDSVLPRTDVLVLATPLTPQTAGLIGAARMGLLPDGAVIVNIARGPVLDTDALIEVLRDGLPGGGRLLGVALDVTDPEPLPKDSPLWDLPGVLISPHSASTVSTENAVLTDLFVDNLGRWRDGRPLRNLFDRTRGY